MMETLPFGRKPDESKVVVESQLIAEEVMVKLRVEKNDLGHAGQPFTLSSSNVKAARGGSE